MPNYYINKYGIILVLLFFVTTFVTESYAVPSCESGNTKLCKNGWGDTPIDNSRTCNKTLCGNMNCWKCDDTKRDHLEMNPDKINFITRLKETGKLPQDGRYIYVYRKDKDDIFVRPYDRNVSDKQWMFSGNCKLKSKFGQYNCPIDGQTGTYLHVRHSQLNGGWDPIWCGGEMRIKDSMVCIVNNESGHFKPPVSCLDYVHIALENWGIPVASDAVFADFNSNSASKQCKTDNRHDEL